MTWTPLAQDDIVLVCSDGLFGVVDDAEIRELLSTWARNLGVACEQLVARANEHGGPDNISCAAFVVAGEGLPAPSLPVSITALTPPPTFR